MHIQATTRCSADILILYLSSKAFFNDLHKGRHSGAVWFWFIDLFAVATLLFALTGLALMALHAKRRPATWPVTALGLIVPWLLIALFVH